MARYGKETPKRNLAVTTERKHSGNEILRWKKAAKELQMSYKLPVKRSLKKTVEVSSDGIG